MLRLALFVVPESFLREVYRIRTDDLHLDRVARWTSYANTPCRKLPAHRRIPSPNTPRARTMMKNLSGIPTRPDRFRDRVSKRGQVLACFVRWREDFAEELPVSLPTCLSLCPCRASCDKLLVKLPRFSRLLLTSRLPCPALFDVAVLPRVSIVAFALLLLRELPVPFHLSTFKLRCSLHRCVRRQNKKTACFDACGLDVVGKLLEVGKTYVRLRPPWTQDRRSAYLCAHQCD